MQIKYIMKKVIKMLINKRVLSIKSQGMSMIPLLQPYDMIYFKKISFNLLKINDIVTIQLKNKLITHRIIYKTNNYLITKGDSNHQSDGKIYPRKIVGKVYQVKRNGKVFNPEDLYLIQSTQYLQEIFKIKTVFENEKIDFVFLKGLPLHLYFEKTYPRRIYADCDVLVNKKDFLKAEKIIKKFGYRKTDSKDKKVENNYFKIINGFSVVFDIHLEPAFLMTQFSGLEALYPQKLIDQLTEELLKNKKKVKVNGETFLILNTYYLILYLALHLFHHNFRGAFRYQFLDTVIKKNRLSINDWQKIASTINEYKLGNFVYPVFILLKKYYQSPIPKSFLKTIKPHNFMNIMNFINFKNLNIFDDEPRIRAGITRFKNLFFLSPNPWWKKVMIFLNLQVIYSILWVVVKRLFRRK